MANKQKVKGSEALLLSLIAEQTDIIFGYPGGQVIPIYDRLYDFKGRIEHILTRHEQGAVHAAQGYARVTGRVGVCMATSGPGATNLVTGIADAMLDSTPLVCITGQVPQSLLGTDAFQEADIISMTMPVTKWNYQVTSASEIAPAIARAFYIARSGRPGPVLIDIAKNAQVEDCEFNYKPCLGLRSYKPNPIVDTTATKTAVEMINAAERPLVLVGQGIMLSGAEKELLEFAEIGNLPMGQTLMAISTVPNSHPLFVGNLGMHGNIPANSMTQKADLIIALGLRFSDRITGNTAKYAPEAKVIHIDVDKAELGKNIRVDVPIHANLKDAIELLKQGLCYKERKEWFDFAAEKKEMENTNLVVPSRGDDLPYITMSRVIQELASQTKGDAIVVTDVGQNQMFSALYSKFNFSRSFVTSGGLGTMGFGLPAAMGAKLGKQDKEVIAVMGDGGFQMSMQELGTIMQNRIGVKMLIMNNTFLGMVRQWQQLFFERRYSFTKLENPDFAKVAAAYNIPSKRIIKKEDLEGAIQEMLATKGSYLLEVCVENEENVFPMVPAGASLSESIYKAEQ